MQQEKKYLTSSLFFFIHKRLCLSLCKNNFTININCFQITLIVSNGVSCGYKVRPDAKHRYSLQLVLIFLEIHFNREW